MKFTPIQILQLLGFTVPPDGVEVNPHDAFFYTSALELIGQTMNADRIPDEALHGRHAGLITEHGADVVSYDTAENAEKSRILLRLALKHKFGATI